MSLQLPLPCPAQTVLLPQVVLMLYSHWSWAQPCGGGSASQAASLTARHAALLPGRWDGTGESPLALIGGGASWGCAQPQSQTRLDPCTPVPWDLVVGTGDGCPPWLDRARRRDAPSLCPAAGPAPWLVSSHAEGRAVAPKALSLGPGWGGDALQRVFWSCRDKFR